MGGSPEIVRDATHAHGVRAPLTSAAFVLETRLVEQGTSTRPDWQSWLIPSGLTALLLWSTWPVVESMIDRWVNDPRYSHGILVPIFASYLLWRRRSWCPGPARLPDYRGVALIACGVATQLAGAVIYLGWLGGFALILSIAGVIMIWGGPKALRWATPSLAFLVFMIPLPYRFEVALGKPLQRIGTVVSTYLLQTAGLSAIAEGNIIRLDDRASIAVVEACNGLGMIVAFACYATAAAMMMEQRNLVTRIIILLSAAPLALVANISRITATGLVHSALGGGAADLVFHDLAGWLMMPLALGLLWAELILLGTLIIEQKRGDLASLALKQALFRSTSRHR